MHKPILVRLEPDIERQPFNCGHDDLNEFFHKDSIAHSKHLLAVTYAYIMDGKTIAYYSVLNDNIRKEKAEKGEWKRAVKNIPHGKRGYDTQPAVKVGRFAVAEEYQKSGIGSSLMDYIKGHFTDKNKTGCRFITVDAYKTSVGFYLKNGFEFFTTRDKDEESRVMWFDLMRFIRE